MTPANEVLIVEPSTAFSNILKQLIFQSHGFHADVAHDLRSLRSLIDRKASGYFVAIVNTQLENPPNGKAIEACIEADIPTLVFVPNQGTLKHLDLWQLGIADYAFKSGAYSLEHIVWSVKRCFLNRKTQLVVGGSDSPEFALVARRMTQLGFKVDYQHNEDNIMMAIHQRADLELVILDCTQAAFDGIGLLNELRETQGMNELEVITITDDPTLAATLYKSGSSDVITLPLLAESLIYSINQSAERLEQRKQLKSLQQEKIHLISTAAHDIRSPISAVKSAAGLLLNKNTPPQRMKPLVTMIEENSGQLLNHIEQLLELSVMPHGQLNLQMEIIDLGKIVAERVALHRIEAETKLVDMKLESHPSIRIKADKLKFKQIIDKLLSNAIKVAPDKTQIVISTAQSQQLAFFRVVDAGPEVMREEIRDLFKPYAMINNGNNNRKNLSLLKRLVEAHEGKIYYNRNKTGQNTFSVELPAL